MKYFDMKECVYSNIAQMKHIDNTPSSIVEAHIRESVETLIDPLREAWGEYCIQYELGSPCIRISSGYRSPELNKAIEGSCSSAHCHGYAFDLQPTNGNMMEFKKFCRTFLKDKEFDQLISEGEQQGVPAWMHVGYKSPSGEQRKQFLSMIKQRYFPMTD